MRTDRQHISDVVTCDALTRCVGTLYNRAIFNRRFLHQAHHGRLNAVAAKVKKVADAIIKAEKATGTERKLIAVSARPCRSHSSKLVSAP